MHRFSNEQQTETTTLKQLSLMKTASYINESNAQKQASKRQLWALYTLSKKCGEKHDYRQDSLTMSQASELIKKFNAKVTLGETIGVGETAKVQQRPRKKTLEDEFLAYMTESMEGVIAAARRALKIQSVVEDDPSFTPKDKCKKYAFFGYGCGITIIKFDQRSKVGKEIIELSAKHKQTTFLSMFLKDFSKEEIRYYQNVGCPLQALYSQDLQINLAYQQAVASFMIRKGVRNVSTRTFDD